ncbi:calpain-5-like [Oryzias melastigma]|uniref:calpain-5-like n=1 Tax=Oryzias melastigma TaxID=30732 RepID=UPI00168D1563|nr:calpain-5-like [Oryzias melastigma]
MGSAIFSPARSVFKSYNLPKGRYVVIPSTLQAGVQGQFMLRIFTDEDSSCREMTEEEPKKENWSMCIGNVGVVIYARVKNAKGLENQDNTEAGSPFNHQRKRSPEF